MNMQMKRFALGAAVLLMTAAAQATSINWAFSYTGAASGSGLLTTDPLSGGFYTITGISGTGTGGTILALLPAGNDPVSCSGGCLISDNKLFPGSPALDFYGFTFHTAVDDFNIYYDSGSYYDLSLKTWQTHCSTGCSGSDSNAIAARISFSLFQVPEPATLALFGLGVLALGVARRRKSI
jgi:hypothetical protein